MRNKAYDELVDFCKSVGFVSADRDFVSKKIQNANAMTKRSSIFLTTARKLLKVITFYAPVQTAVQTLENQFTRTVRNVCLDYVSFVGNPNCECIFNRN